MQTYFFDTTLFLIALNISLAANGTSDMGMIRSHAVGARATLSKMPLTPGM
jgi:hypothetical protein